VNVPVPVNVPGSEVMDGGACDFGQGHGHVHVHGQSSEGVRTGSRVDETASHDVLGPSHDERARSHDVRGPSRAEGAPSHDPRDPSHVEGMAPWENRPGPLTFPVLNPDLVRPRK
jgi:hypothetical protein